MSVGGRRGEGIIHTLHLFCLAYCFMFALGEILWLDCTQARRIFELSLYAAGSREFSASIRDKFVFAMLRYPYYIECLYALCSVCSDSEC